MVTLVPKLWYESDNSFGTVVTIGIGHIHVDLGIEFSQAKLL